MTEDEQKGLTDALAGFASLRLDELARKAIYRLQRTPDAGAHPYGWDMKTLWNLYSWNVQNGPIDGAEMLEDMVTDEAEAVVAKLSHPEAVLLSAAVATEPLASDMRADDLIVKAVRDRISSLAAKRDLERFDPEYRWYENV